MNRVLMESIVRHIFSNFAIIPSSFVNLNKTKTLKSKEFLLPEKISFATETSTIIENRVWGCQISVDQQDIKILLADCSQEENIPEYSILVSLKNAPSYGVYLVYNDMAPNQVNSEPLIGCSLNGKEWIECSTFLQATFLAGMEQIRDVGLAWDKCTSYKDQFNALISFTKFHATVYEDQYEGQEN
jgi:hypothetical protein